MTSEQINKLPPMTCDVLVDGKLISVSAVCYGEELSDEEIVADAIRLAGGGTSARIVSRCPDGEGSNVIPFRKRA